MSVQERNLATIRAYNAAFGDQGALARFVAKDVVNFGAPSSPEEITAVQKDVLTRFPDVVLTSKETIAVGDYVIDRLIYSGTHLGVWRMTGGGRTIDVAATGKRFAVQHIHWWTLKDGLIVAHDACRDDISMMMQLGLLPYIKPVAEQDYVSEPPIAHRNVAGGPAQARNIAAVQANLSAIANRDMEAALDGYAHDAVNHGRAAGRERMRAVLSSIFDAYTPVGGDEPVEIVAVDDCVVASLRRTLKHTGAPTIPVDGGLLVGKPASNKTFKQHHIHWWTLKDGLIVSHRACRDDVGMMIQLGMMPPLTAQAPPVKGA